MLASIDRGTGPAALLLHGQPGSGASWDPLTDRLAPEFRVLAPDRIGYGASAGRGPWASRPTPSSGRRSSGSAGCLAGHRGGPQLVGRRRRLPGRPAPLPGPGPGVGRRGLYRRQRQRPRPVAHGAGGRRRPDLGGTGGDQLGPAPGAAGSPPDLPSRYRDQTAASLPEEGFLERGRGSLARQRRTFMVEQRALNDELPGGGGAALHPGPSGGGGLGPVGPGGAAPGRGRGWPGPSPAPN